MNRILLLLMPIISLCYCTEKTCVPPPFIQQYGNMLDKEFYQLSRKISEMRSSLSLIDTIINTSNRWLKHPDNLNETVFDSFVYAQPSASAKYYLPSFSVSDTARKYGKSCDSFYIPLRIKEYRNQCLRLIERGYFGETMSGIVPIPLIIGKDTFLQLSQPIPVLGIKVFKITETSRTPIKENIVRDEFGLYLIEINKLKKGKYIAEIESYTHKGKTMLPYPFQIPLNN
jgi:hypothetical protein